MHLQLDPVELRVLGSLMEKEATTPEYYPLSLNALINACNQKSNRDPVVSYDEDTVEDALDRLRDKGLTTRLTGPDMRVPKHGQRLTEVFNLGRRESAVLCVLMLRGPQTPGELRGRTERLYSFEDLEAVEGCLNRLMERESGALVMKLPRQAGYKEARFAHLLGGEAPVAEPEPAPAASSTPNELEMLRSAVETLRGEVADMKRKLAEFQKQFE